jgi:hypothetical protein
MDAESGSNRGLIIGQKVKRTSERENGGRSANYDGENDSRIGGSPTKQNFYRGRSFL